MSTFKIGDRVRVINNSGAPSLYKVGEVCTVKRVDNGLVRCEGKAVGMFDRRFELVPAFKIGDRVRCLEDYDPGRQFTKGKTYVVTDVCRHSLGVIDDIGRENGWNIDRFELAPVGSTVAPVVEPTGTFIVIVEDAEEGLQPSTSPRIHGTRALAEAEARRLANAAGSREEDHKSFIVFQAVSRSETTVVRTVTAATTKEI